MVNTVNMYFSSKLHRAITIAVVLVMLNTTLLFVMSQSVCKGALWALIPTAHIRVSEPQNDLGEKGNALHNRSEQLLHHQGPFACAILFSLTSSGCIYRGFTPLNSSFRF